MGASQERRVGPAPSAAWLSASELSELLCYDALPWASSLWTETSDSMSQNKLLLFVNGSLLVLFVTGSESCTNELPVHWCDCLAFSLQT